jgi:hypothetical protein
MIFTVVRNDGNDYNCGFTDPDVKWQTVKFRESKKNVLKIVLIIVNINKDENKSLISNQFSPKIIVISYHNHFVPQ